MRFAYADPPYFGNCGLYKHRHEEPYGCWDDLTTHADLINNLVDGFPDGWALSTGSVQLQEMLRLAPRGVRIGAWVKPFSHYFPNVSPAYAWEPVLFHGGRRGRDRSGGRGERTVRDWHSENMTLRKGVAGAKPASFCRWILGLLGYEEGDDLVDVFPGTGIMDVVSGKTPLQTGLFEETENVG